MPLLSLPLPWARRKAVVLSFLAVLLSCVFVTVNSISYEEDVTLTAKEKNALDKFKLQVIPKIPKTSYLRNYINDDLYFIHWLRARKLNIRAAEEMLLAHIKWRERENIDNIYDDDFDWDQYYKDYPAFYNDTMDKEGRPIAEYWLGDLKVRNLVVAGLSRNIIRSHQRLWETLARRVYKARAEGKKVSQAVFIIDVDGFNILEHGCPSCLPLFVAAALMAENHYPYLFDSVMLLNAPSPFQIILNAIRPVLSDSTGKSMKTYWDRRAGLNALDKKVAKNQRSVRIGGTLIRDV